MKGPDQLILRALKRIRRAGDGAQLLGCLPRRPGAPGFTPSTEQTVTSALGQGEQEFQDSQGPFPKGKQGRILRERSNNMRGGGQDVQ